MDRSFDTLKNFPNKTELNFFDCFGNIIEIASNYTDALNKHPEFEPNIAKNKQRFCRRLQEFENSGYIPQGKINPDSVKKLHEFEDLDWTKEENIEEIKKYLWSLRSDK